MYECRFDITENQYKEFLWSHFWHKQIIRVCIVFVIVMTMIAIVIQPYSDQFWIAMGGYAVAWIGLYSLIIIYDIHRKAKLQTKNYGKNIAMVFNIDTIETNYILKGIPSKSLSPYATFKYVALTKNLILLYRSYNLVTIVPKQSLAQGDVDEFITFLKENIQRQNQR